MPYFPPQQTALDILNKIKTVDGSGSGLDADTIDGLHANELSTVAALNDLTDVTISTPATNQVLLYNGSIWVNGTITSGVTDHGALTGLSDNDHPQYYLASNVSSDAQNFLSAINSSLTYNNSNNRLTVTGGLVAPSIRPESDSTNAIGFMKASGTQDFYYDSVNGTFGFGQAAASNSVVTISGTKNTGSIYGVQMQIFANGASSAAYGVYARFRANTGVYSVTNVYGVYGEFTAQTGTTIGSARALYGLVAANSGGTVNTAYGLQIEALGTVGTLYGVYVSSMTQGSTNYAIYTNAGLVRFGDRVILSASTTSRASMTMTAGTAPTSPNDGDIWFDGSHLYCRIAGVTKQLDN